ncbi:MAG: hypothetical protein K2X77_20240 [Candidatus Obscuribacterales bacterium]|jgi:ClpP class serine protease|nr:hypothetical protein [Candidatus Obscuribacterales bacterium]
MHWDKFGEMLTNLLWVWIVFLILQPAMKQNMLAAARTGWLRKLERKRESRVIALVHRRESVSLLGIPILQFIDIEDSEAILRAIRMTGDDVPIDLILHTPGGVSLAAEQIARAICRHKSKVTVFVPHYAMSGGTLLALAANEVVMSRDAVLGALDPMVGQYPAASIMSVAGQKNFDDMSDSTFILLDQARKSTEQMNSTVRFLLSHRHDEPMVEQLASVFTSGNWTQDYPISVDELKEVGMAVNCDMPVEVLQFMAMFPQDVGRRPSVDFIPAPYPPASPVPPVLPAPRDS